MIPKSLFAADRRHHTCLYDAREALPASPGGPPSTGQNKLRVLNPILPLASRAGRADRRGRMVRPPCPRSRSPPPPPLSFSSSAFSCPPALLPPLFLLISFVFPRGPQYGARPAAHRRPHPHSACWRMRTSRRLPPKYLVERERERERRDFSLLGNNASAQNTSVLGCTVLQNHVIEALALDVQDR